MVAGRKLADFLSVIPASQLWMIRLSDLRCELV
jgi:hypothetical protein